MKTALVTCGALGSEVKEIADRRGWDVDIHGLSAYLHLYPDRIVTELSAKLRELRPRYDRLVVVYGDCGTAGRLDPVLDEVGAARVQGLTATKCSRARSCSRQSWTSARVRSF